MLCTSSPQVASVSLVVVPEQRGDTWATVGLYTKLRDCMPLGPKCNPLDSAVHYKMASGLPCVGLGIGLGLEACYETPSWILHGKEKFEG